DVTFPNQKVGVRHRALRAAVGGAAVGRSAAVDLGARVTGIRHGATPSGTRRHGDAGLQNLRRLSARLAFAIALLRVDRLHARPGSERLAVNLRLLTILRRA